MDQKHINAISTQDAVHRPKSQDRKSKSQSRGSDAQCRWGHCNKTERRRVVATLAVAKDARSNRIQRPGSVAETKLLREEYKHNTNLE